TTIDSGQTDFTFADGTTYFVSGSVGLSGTTTFQGAVLKFDDAGVGGSLSLDGSTTVVCSSDPGNPTIFTSFNDDSVGETLDGSSGSPSIFDLSGFFNITRPSVVLSNMCFNYVSSGIYVVGDVDFWNCQFLSVDIAASTDGYYDDNGDFVGGNIGFHNVLIQEIFGDAPVSGAGGSIVAENVTLDGYGVIGGSVTYTNCLLVSEPTWPNDGIPIQPTGNEYIVYISVPGVGGSVYSTASIFQSAANANYYLAPGSPYRDAGTTAIDPALLAELQTTTTYAPQDGGFPDTNGTDLGYHYPLNEDSDHDGLPDWWEYHWFGSFDYSGTNVDANGSTFLDDYNNGTDPNIIDFSIEVTNNYVGTTNASLQLDVTAGVPYYYSVLVDSTNFATANWTAYTSADITACLGTNEGWHVLCVGLKGPAPEATVTWIEKQLKLDTSLPVIVITGPANNTVKVPMIQLAGYSPEELDHISCDVSNALGVVTNLDAGVTDCYHDPVALEFTTNYFECLDIGLTNGVNIVTVHAMDLAGNETVTNFSFTLDYSTATYPVVQLTWPQDGMQLCGDTFTLRGTVDDPTATIFATITDTNGDTNIVFGVVERTGVFWVDNLPLGDGTNWLTLNVTNSAGFPATTNILVVKSTMNVTMNPVSDDSQLWQPTVSVTGTVSDSSYAVWINGAIATVTPDDGDTGGTWSADNVPVTPGGVASFDMTAYPPDEAPDASLSGDGLNPRTANATAANTGPDKPVRLYVASYTCKEHVEVHPGGHGVNADGTPRYSFQSDVVQTSGPLTWTDGKGGGSSFSDDSSISASGTSDDRNGSSTVVEIYKWPASKWPNMVAGTETSTGFEGLLFFDYEDLIASPLAIAQAFQSGGYLTIAQEHCKMDDKKTGQTSYSLPDGSHHWAQDNVVYSRTADTVMKLYTGGRALSQQQNLFCLSAKARRTQGMKLKPNLLGPAVYWEWDLPPIWGPESDVASTDITVDGQPLGADGNQWRLYKDDDTRIVTPQVKNQDYYTFTVGQQKYYLISRCGCPLADLDRTTVGVAEYVTLFFSTDPKGANSVNFTTTAWKTSAGSISPAIGYSTIFTAPSNAATATVTATVHGQSVTKDFNILEPSGIKAKIRSHDSYVVGTVGAGMEMDVVLQPTTVSFNRVQIKEPGAAATGKTYYFASHAPPNHDSDHGANAWHPVTCDNLVSDAHFDHAWSAGWPIGQHGSYTWPISPIWSVGGDDSNSHPLSGWTDQIMTLSSDGTMKVDKLGCSDVRSP
ncbi:MAG TPA: hypothetical protein VK815_16940, partial [Candidatus Acidoferrales bacterium]|nr:hypothetical protein [Candidatus Acidoferrales bacterium]